MEVDEEKDSSMQAAGAGGFAGAGGSAGSGGSGGAGGSTSGMAAAFGGAAVAAQEAAGVKDEDPAITAANEKMLSEIGELRRVAMEVYSNVKAYEKEQMNRVETLLLSSLDGDRIRASRDGLAAIIHQFRGNFNDNIDQIMTCVAQATENMAQQLGPKSSETFVGDMSLGGLERYDGSNLVRPAYTSNNLLATCAPICGFLCWAGSC